MPAFKKDKVCRKLEGFDWLDITETKENGKCLRDTIEEFYGENRPHERAPGKFSRIEIKVEPDTGLVCSFKVDGIELGKTSLGDIEFKKRPGDFAIVTAEFITNNIEIDVPSAKEIQFKSNAQTQHQCQKSWRGMPISKKVQKILMKSHRERY